MRSITIYTMLVLASGWFGRWLEALAGDTSEEGLGMLIWIASPLIISLLLRALAGDGWRDLGIKPAFNGNGLWYGLSIVVYPICAALALIIGLAIGVTALSAAANVSALLQAASLLLVAQLPTNIAEEFGFRGYLAPKLYQRNMNTLVAHILVGLIWGLWHLPYLTTITPYTTESLTTLLPRFLLGTIAASIVYGEIRIRTNSVWPAVLMQSAGGLLIGALMSDGLIMISSMAWLFSPVLEGGLTIVLFALIGISLYRWRIWNVA